MSQAIECNIDSVSAEAIQGWAAHASEIREIRVLIDDQHAGKAISGLARPDVAAARKHLSDAGQSGFSFTFPADAFGRKPEAIVKLEFEASDGTRLEIARKIIAAKFTADDFVRAENEEFLLAPFPHDVVRALQILRPGEYTDRGVWNTQLIARAVADITQLIRERTLVAPVLRYALYLSSLAHTFEFIGKHFARVNSLSTPDAKDGHAAATSPHGMLCIANHLYVLKSYGFTGTFVECGCFKGFSSTCLSTASAALGLKMDIYDSFAGLPPGIGSSYYKEGEFCGPIEEVTENLKTFGRLDAVSLHKGYFSETVPHRRDPVFCLWMDVDLHSSAVDVMAMLPKLHPASCVFTDELQPHSFVDGKPVLDSTEVLPPIAEAFQRSSRDPEGTYLTGCIGALYDRTRGIRPLDLASILTIVKST